MDALDNADQELKAIAGRIADVENALLKPSADTPYLRKEKYQLRKEQEQLREEENIVLSKEKLNIELKARQSPGK